MRRHLTFANVMSSLALFVALGGTSYALATGSIGSREIKNNSVRSKDVRNGALTGRDVRRNSLGRREIRESRLGKVRRAREADRLGGVTAGELRLRCPAGTQPTSGTCIEITPRPPQAYDPARSSCELDERRLPTHQELVGYVDGGPTLAPGGELTAHVYPDGGPEGNVNVLVMIDDVGGVALVPNTFEAGRRAFRCVVDPSNN